MLPESKTLAKSISKEIKFFLEKGLYIWWIVAFANLLVLLILFIFEKPSFRHSYGFMFFFIFMCLILVLPIILSRFKWGSYYFLIALLLLSIYVLTSVYGSVTCVISYTPMSPDVSPTIEPCYDNARLQEILMILSLFLFPFLFIMVRLIKRCEPKKFIAFGCGVLVVIWSLFFYLIFPF